MCALSPTVRLKRTRALCELAVPCRDCVEAGNTLSRGTLVRTGHVVGTVSKVSKSDGFHGYAYPARYIHTDGASS